MFINQYGRRTYYIIFTNKHKQMNINTFFGCSSSTTDSEKQSSPPPEKKFKTQTLQASTANKKKDTSFR